MIFSNYKKNKLEKIKAFCAVVEQGSLAKASEYLSIAASAISAQVASLEHDLNIQLFDRSTKHLKLNAIGIEYYKNAKNVLSVVDNFFYNVQHLEVTKYDIWVLKIREFYNLEKHKIIKKIKKWVLKGIKYFLIFVLFSIVSFSYYLNKTNYFFDKNLYSFASPLLKNLIKDGYYRISEDVSCSFGVTQLNLDMYQLILKMTDTKKYKNLPIISFLVADNPSVSVRFTGDEKIDKVFRDKEFLTCNTDQNYNAAKRSFLTSTKFFLRDKNFKIYNLYRNSLDSCLNCNYFKDNIKKYPHNLFGIKTDKINGVQDSRVWIINYNNYYYLLSMTNIISAENAKKNNNLEAKHERHIFWKKLKLGELMSYDNGTYWKLIKDHNMRFD